MSEPEVTTPITVITGFLGSGKTTLLSKLLRHPGMDKAAVIINEFGEVGLDHDLVKTTGEEPILMESGCLCCTLRTDLVETLHDLFGRRARGDVPEFDRVVIETTGLADPAPIVHTLIADPLIGRCFHLDSVIATVDAATGDQTLDNHEESVRQAAIADRLLITKTDIADPAAVSALDERLNQINPGADRFRVLNGEIEPTRLFGAGLYDPETKSADVQRWLNEEAYADEAAAKDGGHDHAHDHAHDHGRGHGHDHHDGIHAFCLYRETSMSWENWVGFLQSLIDARGQDMLRIKGILNVDGLDQPVAVHGVQHVFHPPAILEAWPTDDRRSRLVFIAKDIPEQVIRTMLDSWGAEVKTD
jgi:G3E family GTPase